MTTIAASQSNSALRFNTPRLSPTFLRGAAKLSMTVAIFAAIVAASYLVIPRLGVQGVAAYGVGFLVQATTSATVLVPVTGIPALVVMSQDLNLLTLAVFGAAGGALGELFGYWLGSQGRGPLSNMRLYHRLETAMQRRGGLVVFLFAAVPLLPMDAAGIVAGVTRYPLGRFLTAMFAGKLLLLLTLFLVAREFLTALSFLNAWLT